jgi:hypothetical protein
MKLLIMQFSPFSSQRIIIESHLTIEKTYFLYRNLLFPGYENKHRHWQSFALPNIGVMLPHLHSLTCILCRTEKHNREVGTHCSYSQGS